MSKELVSKQYSQIPPEIREVLEKPFLLSTEDPKVYEKFELAFANSVQPADIFEWEWTRDMVDQKWEIRRLKKLKAELMEDWLKFDMTYKEGLIMLNGLDPYERIDALIASINQSINIPTFFS
jgi:hypothetical protein